MKFFLTYTSWRFVRFPMVGERLPDKFWLGAPLLTKIVSTISDSILKTKICNQTCFFPVLKKKQKTKAKPNMPLSSTYKPITRPSGEQVIIFQSQGSTESSSQLPKTPWGSTRKFFMPIKAFTEENKIKKKKKTDHFLFQKKFSFTYKFNRVQIRKQVQFTFKINTFWWKQSTCRIPQAEQGKTTQEKLLFPHFHCSPVLICSSKKANLS